MLVKSHIFFVTQLACKGPERSWSPGRVVSEMWLLPASAPWSLPVESQAPHFISDYPGGLKICKSQYTCRRPKYHKWIHKWSIIYTYPAKKSLDTNQIRHPFAIIFSPTLQKKWFKAAKPPDPATPQRRPGPSAQCASRGPVRSRSASRGLSRAIRSSRLRRAVEASPLTGWEWKSLEMSKGRVQKLEFRWI